MKYIVFLVLAVSLLLKSDAASRPICTAIPYNNEKYETTSPTGISQTEFTDVINEFYKVYSPIVIQQGYNLVIKNKWNDATVNSDTTVNGTKWIINAYGGLARYPTMDADTYMMVLCHEVGHHLGGYPKEQWATNEGQSDYFATSKCFARMSYSRQWNRDVPKIVSQRCSVLHKSQIEINICEKASIVGLNLGRILNSLANGRKTIDLATPNLSQVKVMYNDHPEAQCRADTYFAGAVCGISYNEEFSDTSPLPGSCAEEKGDKIGYRPRCWYKPNL
jgi:hypothetical protein